MTYYKGDVIRIKTISGFRPELLKRTGYDFRVRCDTNGDYGMDVESVRTGEMFTMTKCYYEIEVLNRYELPLELFEI